MAGRIAIELSKIEDLILALEIQQENQAGLDEYMKARDKRFLKILGHFAAEYKDGRSSMAADGL